MWRISKWIVGLVAIIGIYSYALTWGQFLNSGHLTMAPFSKLFLYSFAGGFLFWFFLGRFLRFFHTFEHELTHLLVGLIFLKRPHAFFASEDEGGVVSLYGSNFIVTLSPYFLPTFSLLVLPFFPIIQPNFYPHLYIVLGFLTGYHLLSTLQEFSFRQPDIRISGITFSVLFCAFANLAIFGFILAFVQGGFSNSWSFLKEGYALGADTAYIFAHKIQSITR